MARLARPAPAEPDRGAELDALKEQASQLEDILTGIRQRLDALEVKPKPE